MIAEVGHEGFEHRALVLFDELFTGAERLPVFGRGDILALFDYLRALTQVQEGDRSELAVVVVVVDFIRHSGLFTFIRPHVPNFGQL